MITKAAMRNQIDEHEQSISQTETDMMQPLTVCLILSLAEFLCLHCNVHAWFPVNLARLNCDHIYSIQIRVGLGL